MIKKKEEKTEWIFILVITITRSFFDLECLWRTENTIRVMSPASPDSSLEVGLDPVRLRSFSNIGLALAQNWSWLKLSRRLRCLLWAIII